MSFNATRLTLYAIISAIETDLRSLIMDHLSSSGTAISVLGNELHGKCIERSTKESPLVDTNATIEQLLPYVDFGDAYQLLQSNAQQLPATLRSSLISHIVYFETLAPIRNRVMHTRPLLLDDFPTTLDGAHLLVKDKHIWTELSNTLIRITDDPSYVLGLNINSYGDDQSSISHNLPIPDFDETGFVGRNDQTRTLNRLCRGPYPVITIVAEGGVGKTALALKVAYDIVDADDKPFDAVIWTTSRTHILTVNDIRKIDDAITDSLGMLSNVAIELGGINIVDPMQEVLSYLKEFRILLIIDNLESIIDERIHELMSSLPSGSKVLITSRIGLGAYDYPVNLEPMDESDAILLLRTLAKIRGLSELTKVNNKNLAILCRRMKNNPGFIKWFVAAVQSGKRPEEVLAEPDLFLDFCMSNIYTTLSDSALKILKSMVSHPVPHSQAELAFLNDLDTVHTQHALRSLLSTNMVALMAHPKETSYVSTYVLNDLARSFMKRLHPVSQSEISVYTKRKQQLLSAGEQLEEGLMKNPYSFRSVNIRSRGDIIVAKYLLDAIKSIMGQKDYDAAQELISNAKSLAPDYYEVHRVDAFLKFSQDNLPAARDAYDAAIELEPNSAPLRFWYGGFLLRSFDDLDGALHQYQEAHRLDSSSALIQIEIARIKVYKGQYPEADAIFNTLSETPGLTVWTKRKIIDLRLQTYKRWAEYCSREEQDQDSALGHLESFRTIYDGCPVGVIDEKIRIKLVSSLSTLRSLEKYIKKKDSLILRSTVLKEWFTSRINDTDNTGKDEYNQEGSILRLLRDKRFGFIARSGQDEIFFHYSELSPPELADTITVDNNVVFVESSRDNRPCAMHVRLKTD